MNKLPDNEKIWITIENLIETLKTATDIHNEYLAREASVEIFKQLNELKKE